VQAVHTGFRFYLASGYRNPFFTLRYTSSIQTLTVDYIHGRLRRGASVRSDVAIDVCARARTREIHALYMYIAFSGTLITRHHTLWQNVSNILCILDYRIPLNFQQKHKESPIYVHTYIIYTSEHKKRKYILSDEVYDKRGRAKLRFAILSWDVLQYRRVDKQGKNIW